MKTFTAHNLSASGAIRHRFFSRQGGFSQGYYRSLCFSPIREGSPENFRKNKTVVAHELGTLPERILLANQMHSARVEFIAEPFIFENRPIADAMVTKTKGLALSVNTADCVPVLLYDPDTQMIAVIHAGWRGVTLGVLSNTIQMMQEQGATLQNVCAAIGPCIAQNNYEVGNDVYEIFRFLDLQNESYFERNKTGRWNFNLAQCVSDYLHKLGIKNIENIQQDTYGNPDLFFSCRRAFHDNEPTFGGQLSTIMLI